MSEGAAQLAHLFERFGTSIRRVAPVRIVEPFADALLECTRDHAHLGKSERPGGAAQAMQLAAQRFERRELVRGAPHPGGAVGDPIADARARDLILLSQRGERRGGAEVAGTGGHERCEAVGVVVVNGRIDGSGRRAASYPSLVRRGVPRQRHDSRRPVLAAGRAPPLPSRAMRLLCVDDEEDIRTILSLALSLEPSFEVEIVESGPTLLARVRDARPDAIVLDGMMPGLDGYETCRRLKADPATAAIPVVFLTAKTQRAEVARAISLGAVACLTKPFDPLTIAGELRSALGR